MSSFLIKERSLDDFQTSLDKLSETIKTTFKVTPKQKPIVKKSTIETDLKKVVKFTQVKQPQPFKLSKNKSVKTFEQSEDLNNKKLVKQISKLIPKQKDDTKLIKLISSHLNNFKQVTPIEQKEIDLKPISQLKKQVEMSFKSVSMSFKKVLKSVSDLKKPIVKTEKKPKVIVKKEIVKQPKVIQPKVPIVKTEKQPKVIVKKEIVKQLKVIEKQTIVKTEKKPKVVNRVETKGKPIKTDLRTPKTDLKQVTNVIDKSISTSGKLIRNDLKDVKSILISRESVTIGSIGKLIEKSNKTMDSKLDKLISVVSSMNVGTKTEQVKPTPPSPSSVGFNQLPSI